MGASGYLLKRRREEIVHAMRTSIAGRADVQHIAQGRPIFNGTALDKPAENLTKRETDVLGYVARGYTNKEIADFGLSTETVHGYLKTILYQAARPLPERRRP